MKRALSILVIATVLGGCCKVGCVEQNLETRFVNFEYTDIDTIVTRIYIPGTNFSNPIDSSLFRFGTVTMDTVYIGLFYAIDYSKDIEVFLPSTGDKYHVTDIKSRREKCACGQTRKVVTEYNLDGVHHLGEDIFLVKH